MKQVYLEREPIIDEMMDTIVIVLATVAAPKVSVKKMTEASLVGICCRCMFTVNPHLICDYFLN
jgi:hypothetical protein